MHTRLLPTHKCTRSRVCDLLVCTETPHASSFVTLLCVVSAHRKKAKSGKGGKGTDGEAEGAGAAAGGDDSAGEGKSD